MTIQPRRVMHSTVSSLYGVLASAAFGSHASIEDQGRLLADRIASFLPATGEPGAAALRPAGHAVGRTCGTDDLAGLLIVPAAVRSCDR